MSHVRVTWQSVTDDERALVQPELTHEYVLELDTRGRIVAAERCVPGYVIPLTDEQVELLRHHVPYSAYELLDRAADQRAEAEVDRLMAPTVSDGEVGYLNDARAS